MSTRNLEERVYRNLIRVPAGKVTTYKELSKSVGLKNGQRSVGRIMKNNPSLISVPCHRVVRSDGSVGGYVLGQDVKSGLLSREGVEIENGKVKNFGQTLFRFC